MRLSYFKGLYKIPVRWFSKIQEAIIQEASISSVENNNKRILNPVSTLPCKQQNQLYQVDPNNIQYTKAFKDTRPLRAVDKYLELKKSYPDHYLLLYQIGEFYEFYGQDAIRASKLLDIVLGKKIFAVPLKRSKESHEEQVIEFTGFQLRNSEKYIERLVKQGCYLVICDQVAIQPEDNEKLMPRKVTRIMTPGTITEDELLSTPHNNHILSIYLPYDTISNANIGLAWMDISTGLFALTECKMDDLQSYLIRLNPKELVIDTLNSIYLDFLKEKIIFPCVEGIESTIHKRIPCSHRSEYEYHNTLLSSLFDTFYPNHSNSCIESFSTLERYAAVGLMLHIKDTQIDSKPILDIPIQMNKALSMNIDQTSFQALEIFKNSTSGNVQGSLLSVMDATKTASGKRLLMQRLANPSLDIKELQSRFDMVEFFMQNRNWMEELRKALEDLPDMERCLQRLALNRSTGGPNDLISVKKGLKAIYSIQDILIRIRNNSVNITNNTVINWIEMVHKAGIQELQLLEELDRALLDKPSSRLSDGNIIKEEYLGTYHDDHSSIELDRILNQVKNLEEEYRRQTDICSLKIIDLKHLGLLVNIPSTEEQKLRGNQLFKYHSRLSNVIRYNTSELTSLTMERSLLEQERLELEIRIYHHLREKIVSTTPKLRILIKHLSHLDVCIGFAHIACIREYVRPTIINSSNMIFQITGGRHPVVEEMHALSTGRSFTKNDCCLDASQRFWLITGPNMGGKSTFLRQNAIAVILAQIGSFVPANSMTFSLVDSIFTRVCY